jgi:DNA repair exonuclease SbcCD ATPase subunit
MAIVSREYELRISTADAQANIDELNKSFEASESLVLDLEKELVRLNKELDKTEGNSGRAMQKRSNLNKKIKETKAAIQEEKLSLKEINKERKKNNEVIKENTKEAKDYSGVVGILDQQTGGLISGTKNLTGSLAGATKGFNLMRVAIIATGIGALVLGVVALGKAFTTSEEGQNKFAKIMTRISVITGNVSDVLARIGKTLMSVGKVIGTVLTGDFKNLGGAIDDLKNNFSEVTEKVKNFGEETRKELQLANQIADDRAKADKLERQLILDRAEATRKFNELREKAADKENVSIEDRIAALKEAGRIEEEITLKEIEAARIRFETKKLENSLSDSTKEDLDEEAQLQAKLIDLESSRLKKQKTLTAEITTNLREAESERKRIEAERLADEKAADAEEEKARKEKEAKELADAKTLSDLKNNIRDAEAVTEDQRRELEITKTTEHYTNLIELAKQNGLDTANLEAALAEKLKEIRSKGAEETADNEIFWNELTQREKSKIAADGLNNLATVLGTETAAGKAAAIAATTISTFQSAQDSYKSLAGIPIVGPALGIAAAGAAIVSGIATVKKITATPVPKIAGAASSGGASASATPTPPPLPNPPSINSIGTGGVNQLAAAIGETESQPVQAFVVANDVTTAQGLERNIIDGASI